MQLVDYFSLAMKDIRRQVVRTGLTVFALVISTLILVVLTAISLGGRQAITDQFGTDASLTGITVTPNQSSSALSPFGSVQEVNVSASKLTNATVATLDSLPHVQSASPTAQIWEFDTFSLAGSSKQFVASAEGIPSTMSLSLSAGRLFASSDTNVAVIGFAYAQALGYGTSPGSLVGKTINVMTQKGYRGIGAQIPPSSATEQQVATFNQSQTTIPITIVGVTTTGSNQNTIFIPLNWAHAIRTANYSQGAMVKSVDQLASDGYTTIQLTVDNSMNVSSVASAVAQLGYGEVSTLSEVQHIRQFSTTMWVILGAVAVTAALAAALGVVNTMLMMVSEQQYVIGVWRACGARRSFIVKLFLAEATLLGFIGGLLGTGIGVFVSQFVNEYVNELLKSQGLTITNIATVPIWLAIGTVILTGLFALLAGLYPAIRAAYQDPSRALSSGQ